MIPRLESWPNEAVGIVPSFASATFEIDMRAADDIHQGVVFIGVKSGERFTPLGTAFLAGFAFDNYQFPILITASHVVDQIAGERIFVRLNRRGGEGAEVISLLKSRGISHPDKANDITIFPWSASFEIYEHLMWNLDRDREAKAHAGTWIPGPGDEVLTVGLYTSHYGVARNLPVIRVGHIAMTPGEPVRTDAGYVAAYLIETKSIAGLSGSPVLLQVPRFRVAEDGQIQILDQETSLVLGVMIGYHVVESAEDQIAVPQFQAQEFKPVSGTTSEHNTGFAVVVPIERVFEIMESEQVKATLTHAISGHLKQSGFRRASAPAPLERVTQADPAGANPAHKEDFMSLLGEAATTRKPTDQT